MTRTVLQPYFSPHWKVFVFSFTLHCAVVQIPYEERFFQKDLVLVKLFFYLKVSLLGTICKQTWNCSGRCWCLKQQGRSRGSYIECIIILKNRLHSFQACTKHKLAACLMHHVTGTKLIDSPILSSVIHHYVQTPLLNYLSFIERFHKCH